MLSTTDITLDLDLDAAAMKDVRGGYYRNGFDSFAALNAPEVDSGYESEQEHEVAALKNQADLQNKQRFMTVASGWGQAEHRSWTSIR